jgi:hypothetical protein
VVTWFRAGAKRSRDEWAGLGEGQLPGLLEPAPDAMVIVDEDGELARVPRMNAYDEHLP